MADIKVKLDCLKVKEVLPHDGFIFLSSDLNHDLFGPISEWFVGQGFACLGDIAYATLLL